MRPLSKQAEAKLLAALEKVAETVNSGTHPNDAIVKVAREENIPSGHINLMVHAYNTGCTTKQREAGENTIEKSADFKIADANQILDALYPKVVKTSAEIARENVVSTEYALPPTGFIKRRNSVTEKAASAAAALPEKTWQPAPRDEHEEVRRVYSKKAAAKRDYEETRRQATAAYQKAATAMQKLEEYFRVPGNLSFGTVIKAAHAVCGDFGVSVLNKLVDVYPQFKKQAASNKPLDMSDVSQRVPFQLIDEIGEALHQYDTLRDKTAELAPKETKAASTPPPETITGSILHNPAEEALELKKADASGFSMNPLKMTRSLGDTLYQGVGSYIKTPEQMREEAFKDITDPEHERKLRNIRVQGVLSDLVTNDPVISGYEPTEVANAFNELAEIAPNFMDSRATVQALLRKRLESGQLADFDIKQLAELEKIEAEKQRNMMQSKVDQRSLI